MVGDFPFFTAAFRTTRSGTPGVDTVDVWVEDASKSLAGVRDSVESVFAALKGITRATGNRNVTTTIKAMKSRLDNSGFMGFFFRYECPFHILYHISLYRAYWNGVHQLSAVCNRIYQLQRGRTTKVADWSTVMMKGAHDPHSRTSTHMYLQGIGSQ